MPKVSVVCRTYNHATCIAEAIQSVLDQTYHDWELIISDDCSQDDTLSVVKKFDDHRIKILKSEQNIGIISNLNKVISAATGEYIAILDGDDAYYPEKLQKQVEFLDLHQDYGAVFSYIDFIGERNNTTENSYNTILNNPAGNRFEMLAKFFFEDNFLAFPTEMFRKKLAIDFPENLTSLADCRFHVHMLLQSNVHVLKDALVKYRLSEGGSQTSTWYTQISNSVERMFVLDQYLNINDLSLFKSIFADYYPKYGEPTEEAIPYFICRIAMDSAGSKFWGYYTLSKLFYNRDYFDYIMKTYNLSYKDYIVIKKGRDVQDVKPANDQDFINSLSDASKFQSKRIKFLGCTILKIRPKLSFRTVYYLFGFIPVFIRLRNLKPDLNR